jgi:colanic acid/amylovoran biosynthesis glycosyltransferase
MSTSSKGRVVLIVPAFPKLSETFIVSKFLGLLERGWDVHIVCSHSDAGQWRFFPQLNDRDIRTRVHVTPHIGGSRVTRAVRAPVVVARTSRQGPRAIRRYLSKAHPKLGSRSYRTAIIDSPLIKISPDLIHFEFGALALDRTYVKEVFDCALVVSFRGYDLNYVGLEQPGYYDEVWKHADAVHCLGEDLWERAQSRGCPPGKPHKLIPPAIDTSFFVGSKESSGILGTSDRPLRLVSVGRLEWKKGYEYALTAVRHLVDRGLEVDYRIVGDGAFRRPIVFGAHQLGLDGCVQLLGPLDPGDVAKEVQRADVFVHAAVSEGFCNAVMEAQAMRTPVVSSDADGLRENVQDGVTGFVVGRRDPIAMADRLEELARDPKLRDSMGTAGRERVSTRFQPSDQLDAFEDLYALALRERGKS